LIQTKEDLLEHIFHNTNPEILADDRKLLKQATYLLDKYGDNPMIYKEVFIQSDYNGKLLSPKDWFKADNTKITFRLDTKKLQRLKDIDVRINGFTNPTERKIFESMMQNSKDLTQAEHLAAMSIDPTYIKLFEQ
jgi:hypothetical protein